MHHAAAFLASPRLRRANVPARGPAPRRRRSYASNGLNQLTQSGSVVPTYDPRGNLTAAGTTTYAYNSENRLVSASGGVSLAYDPLLRLSQVAAGATTTRFGYDGRLLPLLQDFGFRTSLK